MILQVATDHYEEQRRITADVLASAQRVWGRRPPGVFDEWFAEHVDELTALLMGGQERAVMGADEYVAAALAEAGTVIDPDVEINPSRLVGVASDGRPIDTLLENAVINAKRAVEQAPESGSVAALQAWNGVGLDSLMLYMHTQIADAARVATGLAVATRPGAGYVRMLVPPSCSRCVILAGRFYRYSDGFLRHPKCNCRHIPAREDTAEDLRTDPMAYFGSLTTAQQDKLFTRAGAQAIRDGADINQVVNARRGAHGLDVAGRVRRQDVYGQQLHTTTEGVTKRGIAGKVLRERGRNARRTPRLMPEAIYELAGSREEALQLLRMNGYVLDGPGRPPRRGGAVVKAGTSTELTPRVAGGSGGGRPPGPPVTGHDLAVPSDDDPFDGIPFPHEYSLIQNHRLLSSSERETIGLYTQGDYLAINRALRGDIPMTPEVEQQVLELRAALGKFPLPRAYRTSRETEAADLGLASAMISADIIGDVLVEDGFMSTSGLKNPPKIVDREDPVILDVLVPEGTPALLLTEDLTRASASEREVLLIDARELYVLGVFFDEELQLWRIQTRVLGGGEA